VFALIIMVDWSAAASPGPSRPRADRCWIAWAAGDAVSEPEYFRTRADCMARIIALLRRHDGPACVGFDFPFGYPAGSGLGGGRDAARRIARHLTSDDADQNNRFAVAARLNAELSGGPGPFWGCPAAATSAHLSMTKPAFPVAGISEWRIAERFLKETHRRHSISSVWKLYTTGSVGSQALTGLRELALLAATDDLAPRIRFWPFETAWEKALDGIILTEIWPSLYDHTAYDHPIRDARQVLAARDSLLAEMAAGRAPQAFAAPSWLDATAEALCRTEEGWILGVR